MYYKILSNTKVKATMYLRPVFFGLQIALFTLLFNPFILLLLPVSYTSYDLQRLCELGLFAAMGLQIALDPPLRNQISVLIQKISSLKKILILGIFLLGILSASLSRFPRFALLEVGTLFLLLVAVFYMTACCFLFKEKFTRYFMRIMLFCFTINALTALGAFVYFQNAPKTVNVSNFNIILNFLASPGYMNRRFYDDTQVFLIPLLIWFFLRSKNALGLQTLLFFLLSFAFARGILDGSRIYFYAPLAIFIALPVLFGKRSYPFLKIQLLAMMTGALLYFLLYQAYLGYSWSALHVIPTEANLVAHVQSIGLTSLDSRGTLWVTALKLIKLHPLLGVGPLHYGVYAYASESFAAHPHSAWLVFAAEWGLPALLLISILTFVSIRNFIYSTRKITRENDFNAAIACTAALIGGLLMMSIDGLILMPAGEIMFALVAGITLYYSHASSAMEVRQDRIQNANISKMILLFSGTAAFVTIAAGIFPDILSLPQMTYSYLAQCNYACTVSPNYWAQGFIQFY